MIEGAEIAPLSDRLREKSIEAYLGSLEAINRITSSYRIETFTWLICGAWELLLKAKLASDEGDAAIYYNDPIDKKSRTLALRKVANKIFKQNDCCRVNIERVANLRDEACHFLISDLPPEFMGLFQSCILNYNKCLQDWFNISLSDRVPHGMMMLVYDFRPEDRDLQSPKMRGRMDSTTLQFLAEMQNELNERYKEFAGNREFSYSINYKAVLSRDPKEGDLVFSTGDGSEDKVTYIEVAKDPSITHQYRRSDAVLKLNNRIPDVKISTHDFTCITTVHNLLKRPDFYYQGKIPGSPKTYSEACLVWIEHRCKQEPEFILNARERYKNLQGKKRGGKRR